MLRLHPAPRLVGGPRLAIADWFALIVVFQAVIWPLRLSAGWSVTQTAWLDAAIAAWSLLVAAIVAVGGLARRGFEQDTIESLQIAFRLLTRSQLNTSQAVERIRAEVPPCVEVDELLEFIRASERGIVK